jgi:hypothetical protein
MTPGNSWRIQRFLGHNGNHRYLASIELIDAAGWPRSAR